MSLVQVPLVGRQAVFDIPLFMLLLLECLLKANVWDFQFLLLMCNTNLKRSFQIQFTQVLVTKSYVSSKAGQQGLYGQILL